MVKTPTAMIPSGAALWNTDGTTESPLGQYHFWGEPLYGYYNSLDPWVIRRHVELFISAGIDCLVFDATNAHCYFSVVDVWESTWPSGAALAENNRFMNLLISVDGQDNRNALGGFNYIVNRRSSLAGVCSVERTGKSGGKLSYNKTGEGAECAPAGRLGYTYKGN